MMKLVYEIMGLVTSSSTTIFCSGVILCGSLVLLGVGKRSLVSMCKKSNAFSWLLTLSGIALMLFIANL